MYLDTGIYSGPCACGKSHAIVTKMAVIEPGCLKKLESYRAEWHITGKLCALYDANTYRAAAGRRPAAEQEIVLDPAGLHADEASVRLVLARLAPDTAVIAAVGSGTIHDIARYCAHERGLRFLSCPTAASVDGFCSTVCAMTWYGYKKTMPAVAPELVVADTELLAAAPAALIRSGVGDILAKYTALADWQISHVLTGEYFCEKIRGIMADAVQAVRAETQSAGCTGAAACEKVMYALLLSGIAMQMMGSSRPASGAEHHISHMIEMGAEALQPAFPAPHGEKTGVGTLLAVREYKRLAAVPDIAGFAVDFAPLSAAYIRAVYGERLAEAILNENREDCLAGVTRQQLIRCWPAVREIVAGLPEEQELQDILTSIGAKHTLAEIGVAEDKRGILLDASPCVRNRLTLMRLRRMLPLR